MNRRLSPWLGVVCVGLASALAGCDEGPGDRFAPGSSAARGPGESDRTGRTIEGQLVESERPIILKGVIQLIQDAPLNPGGQNFEIATENLNQYFENTPLSEFALNSRARDYLQSRLAPDRLAAIEVREFQTMDGRHIEDCLLYQAIAQRVAGQGSDLERVRRVFDWVVKNVQLVPPEALAPPVPGLGQAEARPFDVLLRGMATESGTWAERSWVFLALCRQLDIDVGLLTYTSPQHPERAPWICVALVEGKPYLFDAGLGLAIPGPEGRGVATLDEAATDPAVLDQLDLFDQAAPYGTHQADLDQARFVVLIDSSPHTFAPRMREFQERLGGKHRMTLFRDPADQRDAFARALGDRLEGVELWPLPLEVHDRLISDPRFVQATQFPIRPFDPILPLLPARMAQLRGDLVTATQDYVGFRFNEHATLTDQKTPIPPEVRHVLDAYATYFLALCHLDQPGTEHAQSAEFLLRQTLKLLPTPAQPGAPYISMYRWGAQANLGRVLESLGHPREAITFYSQEAPTPQHHGDLLRARSLIWANPIEEAD